jgi:ribosomal protein L7/L12
MRFYDYFQSYNNYFWQWEEDAEIIAIPKSNTIAYRKFVNEMIVTLAPQGLPPLGPLLLAIIATNPSGNTSLDALHALLCEYLPSIKTDRYSKAIEFLKLLSELPPAYKVESKRYLVFQAIFENCHHIVSLKDSNAIATDITENRFHKDQLNTPKEWDVVQLDYDFRTIELLHHKFNSVNDIIEKITSLPSLNEQELDINYSETETVTKEFTEQLIENSKTFHVGSLVKRIWSGLNIPVHSALPSEQPIGGVSDLTNKGDFDKLLISEFANDDLVFLSRLANNEALFIRREIPPANNNFERVILIDITLKTWGTPKLIAFATMLAIAKHPKTTIACSVFAIGNAHHRVRIESVSDLIDALLLLEGCLHPVNGLISYFKEFPAHKDRELFLITESSILKQAAMAKAMVDYHSFINYWIYTDDVGNIEVYKKQQSSKKHIQHIQLPLQELWKKEPTIKRTERSDENSLTNYPILFRNSLNSKMVRTTNDGEIFQISTGKALLRFFDSSAKPQQKGWQVLLENLPFTNGDYEIGMLNNGDYLFLMFNPQNRELTIKNIITQESKTIAFTNWRSTAYQSFVFYDQKFYHLNQKGSWSILPNGTVEKDNYIDRKLFEEATEKNKNFSNSHFSGQGSYKNVRGIFINQNNNIVFTEHELFLNAGKHIKIDQLKGQVKLIEAVKISDAEFVFGDGSTIRINKLGMFILKSSDETIPIIYIPAILDASLGVATEYSFAGNEYYYSEPQYEVILENAGENKMQIIKLIKEVTDKGLSDVGNLVGDAPSTLLMNVSKTKAMSLKHALESNGARVTVHLSPFSNSLELEKISTSLFFEKYIHPFVKQILSHGT